MSIYNNREHKSKLNHVRFTHQSMAGPMKRTQMKRIQKRSEIDEPLAKLCREKARALSSFHMIDRRTKIGG